MIFREEIMLHQSSMALTVILLSGNSTSYCLTLRKRAGSNFSFLPQLLHTNRFNGSKRKKTEHSSQTIPFCNSSYVYFGNRVWLDQLFCCFFKKSTSFSWWEFT